MKTKAILWGSAGHARVLRDILVERDIPVVAVIDNDPAAQSISSTIPLFRGAAGLTEAMAGLDEEHLIGAVAIGGGRGRDRLDLLSAMRKAGLETPALVARRAFVAASASVAQGAHVMAMSAVAADARIGEGVIINHGAVVDHECVVSAGAHIAPGATLAGLVEVGETVFVGTGAAVLPRIRIGAGAIVGAGAVVTRDVAPGETVAGCPARTNWKG